MNKERFNILGTYAFCALSALLVCAPNFTAQNCGLGLSTIILIAAYISRAQSDAESLNHHHMTFIIRTIWIYSVLAVIGMTGAGYIIYERGDASSIDAMSQQIMSTGAIPTEADVEAAGDAYLAANHSLIFGTLLMWMFPALVYMMWRVARGGSRAWRNYRVQNLRAWF